MCGAYYAAGHFSLVLLSADVTPKQLDRFIESVISFIILFPINVMFLYEIVPIQ